MGRHLGQRLEPPRIAQVAGKRPQRMGLAAEAIEYVGGQLPEEPMLPAADPIFEMLEQRHGPAGQLDLDPARNGDIERLPQVAEHLPHPENEPPPHGVGQEARPVDRPLAQDQRGIGHPADGRHRPPPRGVPECVQELVRRREHPESECR